MIKAIIFDLDGTLVNSLADLAGSMNFVLNKNGFPIHNEEKYRYFVGDGIPKLVERALPEDNRDAETQKKCLKEFLLYYAEHFYDFTVSYDGIPETVNALKQAGFIIAVVSNKAQNMALKVVEKIFVDIFDLVAGKREGYPAKPDPALTLKVMEELGVKPEECVFVGDSGMDMRTAVNCGSVPVGVLWGFRTENELRENGAEYLLSHPCQLIDLVKEINNVSKF